MMWVASFLLAVVFLASAYGDTASTSLVKRCKNQWCYRTTVIEGWEVYISEHLATGDPAHFKQVYDQVDGDLQHIRNALPIGSLRCFQQIRLYVSLADPVGKNALGIYHYSREVLMQRGLDPDKFQNVELPNSTTYLTSRSIQPAAILHEFGHAYIHRFMTASEQNKLASTYNAAMKSGIYDMVPYFAGENTTSRKAYATTDYYEYFAEIIEAYFWRNDYFPFNRSELKGHDLQGHAFLEELFSRPCSPSVGATWVKN